MLPAPSLSLPPPPLSLSLSLSLLSLSLSLSFSLSLSLPLSFFNVPFLPLPLFFAPLSLAILPFSQSIRSAVLEAATAARTRFVSTWARRVTMKMTAETIQTSIQWTHTAVRASRKRVGVWGGGGGWTNEPYVHSKLKGDCFECVLFALENFITSTKVVTIETGGGGGGLQQSLLKKSRLVSNLCQHYEFSFQESYWPVVKNVELAHR